MRFCETRNKCRQSRNCNLIIIKVSMRWIYVDRYCTTLLPNKNCVLMTFNCGGYVYYRLTSDSTNISRKSATISSIIIKCYSFSYSIICTGIINLKSIYRSSCNGINYSTLSQNFVWFGNKIISSKFIASNIRKSISS